jgi:hypothetical protein
MKRGMRAHRRVGISAGLESEVERKKRLTEALWNRDEEEASADARGAGRDDAQQGDENQRET